jgi:hypothetical protein
MPTRAQLLKPHETALIGRWVLKGSEVEGDEACARIKALVRDYLEEVATDSTGWDTLYRDPTDNRLWELTYPESAEHGGGPPALSVVSPEQARDKYGSSVSASNNALEQTRDG